MNTAGLGSMNKWLERIAITVVLAFVVLVFIGMYATWSDCNAAGGITVRGMFGLVCIRG